MVIDMNEAKLTTLEQLRQFLAGTATVVFKPVPDDTRYAHIADVLGLVDSILTSTRYHARGGPSPDGSPVSKTSGRYRFCLS